ncbi:hypothetical protein CYMTET_46530 [Cymbomonas tetramitiformis]|uniref:Uncharacterized protein n=1 Tax=Cymbomonas tetramitiformis TaxID=36881 RepID=A0AAE0BX68_9CHLO|nr:hypothetical protein CYMTET_46530 [Cymbomonas tetramitiformis]
MGEKVTLRLIELTPPTDVGESFLDELRLKRFNAEEREILDARCQAMVKAGALRPSSLMRAAELTGRVILHAEDLRFNTPAPGTSVTDKMLNLLQATSCNQRESNMMMRSEWGGPEGAVDAALTAPAGLTATQLPFYYEKDQCWRYQPLKYVQKVDIANLRARLKIKYDEVVAGREAIPLLALTDVPCKRFDRQLLQARQRGGTMQGHLVMHCHQHQLRCD